MGCRVTHIYNSNGTEVSVYDTDGNRVWGPDAPTGTPPADPGPAKPTSWPFPETTDPIIQAVRPTTWATVYEVGQGQDYPTIKSALDAEQARRNAETIRNIGPQDFAILRLHPGVYDEKIRSFGQYALVGTTTNRADVRVQKDMDADNGAVLPAVMSIYVENVTFSSTYSATTVPPPGDTRATVWNSNSMQDSTITFCNVNTISNNAVLNSCAMQPGHRNTHFFYKCKFETIGLESQKRKNVFDAPFNVQTGLDVRRPNLPALSSDVMVLDSEAATDCGNLIAGVADLGSGTNDRVAWVGGTLHFDPSWQRAQWYHSHYWNSGHKDYRVHSWAPEGSVFAGEAVEGADLHWGAPDDAEAWRPVGGVGPKARRFFFPQALDKVGELPTATPTSTMQMVPNRWYYIPVTSEEARTWAGVRLNVTQATGGKLRAGLWRAEANKDAPHTWLSLGHESALTVGDVHVHRGTYRNVRIYPGDRLWVGVMADTACTVAAADVGSANRLDMSGISQGVWSQDSTTVVANPTPTAVASGLIPAPVVKTGIV